MIGAGGAAAARFVVWGDLHAGALMPAFQAAADAAGATGLYLGAAGCVPLLGVNQLRWGFEDRAPAAPRRILQAIAARPEIGTVLLVSRWAFYAMGGASGSEAGPPVFIRDGETRAAVPRGERPGLRARPRAHPRRARGARAPGGGGAQAPENEFDLAVAMAPGALARPRGRVRAGPRRLRCAARLRRRALPAAAARAGEVLDLGALLCGARAARWRATGGRSTATATT